MGWGDGVLLHSESPPPEQCTTTAAWIAWAEYFSRIESDCCYANTFAQHRSSFPLFLVSFQICMGASRREQSVTRSCPQDLESHSASQESLGDVYTLLLLTATHQSHDRGGGASHRCIYSDMCSGTLPRVKLQEKLTQQGICFIEIIGNVKPAAATQMTLKRVHSSGSPVHLYVAFTGPRARLKVNRLFCGWYVCLLDFHVFLSSGIGWLFIFIKHFSNLFTPRLAHVNTFPPPQTCQFAVRKQRGLWRWHNNHISSLFVPTCFPKCSSTVFWNWCRNWP